jgi:hypothetical protein
MTPPKSFVDSLQKQLPHLRVRWSRQGEMWHIEQKAARRVELPFYVSEYDDRAIRARDGYVFVVAITDGDRIGCPRCKAEVHVPVLQMRQATCPRCRAAFHAAFYPLADALLEHLRYTDPYRGGVERQMSEIDIHNERRDYRKRRDALNEAGAVAADLFPQLHQIPQVGYTGKEKV